MSWRAGIAVCNTDALGDSAKRMKLPAGISYDGEVVIELCADETGRLSREPKVIASSGIPAVDAAARLRVRKYGIELPKIESTRPNNGFARPGVQYFLPAFVFHEQLVCYAAPASRDSCETCPATTSPPDQELLVREVEAHNVGSKEVVAKKPIEERRQGYVHGLKPPRPEIGAPKVQPTSREAFVLG